MAKNLMTLANWTKIKKTLNTTAFLCTSYNKGSDWRKTFHNILLGLEQSSQLANSVDKPGNELRRFRGLYEYYMSGDGKSLVAERKEFVTQLLPCIIKLVTCGLENNPVSIPPTIRAVEFLSKSYSPSDIDVYEIQLPRSSVASLVASMFLCLTGEDRGYDYPDSDYSNFFLFLEWEKQQECQVAKYKMILNYFRHIQLNGLPKGAMTFRRQVFSKPFKDITDWIYPAELCDLEVRHAGSIEENPNEVLQTDFANEYIGGGALNCGAVQEEIMFCVCPELQASMLFMDKMKENESIQMRGFEPYSRYTGYASSLACAGPWEDMIHRGDGGTPQTYVTAIDAMPHGYGSGRQYQKECLLRELNKAYVGFHQPQLFSSLAQRRPIATGNWGCGVFGGDPQLKSLLQLIAATKAGCEKVIYYPFGDQRVTQLPEIASMLKGMHVENLMKMILQYCSLTPAGRRAVTLFDYMQHEISSGGNN